jgi:PAS domain-containing protein
LGRTQCRIEIPVDESAAPFRNAEGTIHGVVLVFRDVTARKEIEQRLKRLKEQIVSVTDHMAAAVSRCSRDFRYIWVSSALASWLRRPKEQIEGHYIREVIGEQAYGVILPYMERVLAGDRVEYTTEVNYRSPAAGGFTPMCRRDRMARWTAGLRS